MILGDATRISSQWHDHLLARFDRFLVTGGLPAVVRAYATGEDHALVWRQIVADYEQDFIAIELARGGQPLAGWKRSSAGSEIDFIVKTGPATVGHGPGRVQGEHLGEPSPHARPDCLSAFPRPAPRIRRESGESVASLAP